MRREELHKLVWAEPMQTVAKSIGISDVALAKQCRRASVPVPSGITLTDLPAAFFAHHPLGGS